MPVALTDAFALDTAKVHVLRDARHVNILVSRDISGYYTAKIEAWLVNGSLVEIPIGGTITGKLGPCAAASRCSYAQHNPWWKTCVESLKAGDVIHAFFNRNDHRTFGPEYANMNIDTLTIIVDRHTKAGKLKKFHYMVELQMSTPDAHSQMIK